MINPRGVGVEWLLRKGGLAGRVSFEIKTLRQAHEMRVVSRRLGILCLVGGRVGGVVVSALLGGKKVGLATIRWKNSTS